MWLLPPAAVSGARDWATGALPTRPPRAWLSAHCGFVGGLRTLHLFVGSAVIRRAEAL